MMMTNMTTNLDTPLDQQDWTVAMATNFTMPLDEQIGWFPTEMIWVRSVLIAFFMAVGLAGNFLTLVAIKRTPSLHNATTAFIASLGVADLMFCALVMPPEIVLFSENTWLNGNSILCVLQTFLEYLSVAGSLFSISLISLNRFVLIICPPGVYQRLYQRRWVAAQIAGVWSFSLGMLTPTLAGAWGRFGYQPRLRSCAILPVNGRSPNVALFIIAFLVTCAVISVCYLAILIAVLRSNRRQRQHLAPQKGEVRSQRTLRQRRHEVRVTRMSLAVFMAFIVCFAPLTVANIWDVGYDHPVLHVIGYVAVCVSCSINPIIYVTLSKQYRRAYWSLFSCGKPRRSSETSSNVLQAPQAPWSPA
ncbi:G-protein coupled receptor moody-like [Amphibalanus amphitrite]|uniref:G-protein coupled receptor moody-like n=1 Tax=Amphibalanus amphitrite TaxID=1232801 RepID=UPI001C916CEC|nr:G-protein coupled receptor moody-like [Amphibalanus amphitrite]